MMGTDWAGWAAVRSVVEAAIRTGSVATAEIHRFLKSEDFTLDAYKGRPVELPWLGQPTSSVRPAAHPQLPSLPEPPLKAFFTGPTTSTLSAPTDPKVRASFRSRR